jgi:hypothetical protein
LKRAFSVVELLLVIAVISAMAFLSKKYINIDLISETKITTTIKSQIVSISTILLKCKSQSNKFPKYNGNDANDNELTNMKCQTTNPYYIIEDNSMLKNQEINDLSNWYAKEDNYKFNIYLKTLTKNNRLVNSLKSIDNDIENSSSFEDSGYFYFNIEYNK